MTRYFWTGCLVGAATAGAVAGLIVGFDKETSFECVAVPQVTSAVRSAPPPSVGSTSVEGAPCGHSSEQPCEVLEVIDLSTVYAPRSAPITHAEPPLALPAQLTAERVPARIDSEIIPASYQREIPPIVELLTVMPSIEANTPPMIPSTVIEKSSRLDTVAPPVLPESPDSPESHKPINDTPNDEAGEIEETTQPISCPIRDRANRARLGVVFGLIPFRPTLPIRKGDTFPKRLEMGFGSNEESSAPPPRSSSSVPSGADRSGDPHRLDTMELRPSDLPPARPIPF